MPKIRLSVTIDAEVVKELRDRAKQDQRTLSNHINHILKQHLVQERNSHSTDRRES